MDFECWLHVLWKMMNDFLNKRCIMNKNILLILLSVMIIINLNISDSIANDKKTDVKWWSFDKGLDQVVKEKKHVLIDFYTDWCHWCKVMDEKTFSDKDVANNLKQRFITIRLEAENTTQTATFQGKTYNNAELTRAFGVSGFPTVIFLNHKSEIITKIPSYVPPEDFINILEYIDQECYIKNISFEDFLKNKGECDTKK